MNPAGLDPTTLIFVVGSSRSGTTMMGRLLALHPAIFTFGELHFFEQMWAPEPDSPPLTAERARELAARLFAVQRRGYFHPGDWRDFLAEADAVLATPGNGPVRGERIFETFVAEETRAAGKRIGCDQTPRNVFYLGELLRFYPGARVVNLVRDPRDVLLSQKNRWKRRRLGSSGMPWHQVLRSWVNYHPITITKLWVMAVEAAARFEQDPRVLTVRFEQLLSAPDTEVPRLCAFLGVEYQDAMHQVPQKGSSREADRPGATGFRQDAAHAWRRGGLTPEEIRLCQWVAAAPMRRYGYAPDVVPVRPLPWLGQLLKFPLHLAGAFAMNVTRVRNLGGALRRRLGRTPH